MKSFCFLTYVFGWYQDFIPLYIYSCLYAFPKHHVRILLRESLTQNNREALEEIKSFGSFEVIENYQADLSNYKHLPAVRFLLPKYVFDGFDHAYVGDIDFIIYDEQDCDFPQYYLNHCEKTGLPFSNSITVDDGAMRLTGLHFIKVDEYYDRMQPYMGRVLHGDEFAKSIINSYSFDEQILYYMARQAFDLSPLHGYVRPHHGIHFGYVRKRQTGHSFARKTRLQIWLDQKHKLEPLFNSPAFPVLVSKMGDLPKDLVRRVMTILYRPIFL
jgi:hypothetical protein